MKNVLERNREYSERFIQNISNQEVPDHIKKIINGNEISNILDLGCGEGGFIHAIKKEFPRIKITGVDISQRRIKSLKKILVEDDFYCRDICKTHLKNGSFDLINASQVIEHLEDDKKMVREVFRLLKKDGFLSADSVIRKPLSVYKFRNKGKFVLDPTHEREYKNQREFLDLFKKEFKLIKSWVVPVKRKFLSFEIKIPGYYLVYGIWKKRK